MTGETSGVGHDVGDEPAIVHQMDGVDASDQDEMVGQQTAMAAPPHRLAAHHRGRTTGGLLGRPGELGVVAPGAYADLLLVDGNPLRDLGVLGGQGEHLDLIVRAGEIVTNRLGA